MSPQLLRIEEEALRLPTEDREALIERLLDSLASGSPPEVDEAWLVEMERRYREVKEGRVSGHSAEEVLASIPRELGWSS